MSIGTISSPVTWLNGTVVAPQWLQTVQDNINSWIAGTGPTLKSLQIDGTGGSASTVPAAQLKIAPAVLSTTPLALFANSAGNTRYMIDHNGFPDGRISTFKEDWNIVQGSSSTSANPLSNYPMWMTTISGAGASFAGAGTMSSVYGGHVVDIRHGSTTNGAKVFVATTNKMMDPTCTFASWVLEFDAAFDAVGANSVTAYLGLSSAQDPTAATSGFMWFTKRSTDTNWQAQCGTTTPGGTVTTSDTGVAATASGSGLQRFRLEYHGSTTPFGAATVLFSVNDSSPISITSNVPTAQMNIAFGTTLTATAGTSLDFFLGSVNFVWNRFANANG